MSRACRSSREGIWLLRLSSEAEMAEMKRLFEEEAKATGLRQRYEAILNEVTGTAVY